MKAIIILMFVLFGSINGQSKSWSTQIQGVPSPLGSTLIQAPAENGGYRINGQEIIFVLKASEVGELFTSMGQYKSSSKVKVKSVYVSGDFNSWNKNDEHYRMLKVGDAYELRLPLSDFSAQKRYEFKFVLNGKYWVEPNTQYKNLCSSIKDYPGPNNYYFQMP